MLDEGITKVEGRPLRPGRADEEIHVITSYSIHYTKLYESAEEEERDISGHAGLPGEGKTT